MHALSILKNFGRGRFVTPVPFITPLDRFRVRKKVLKLRFLGSYIMYGINANQNLNSYDFEKYLYREFVWKKIENF